MYFWNYVQSMLELLWEGLYILPPTPAAFKNLPVHSFLHSILDILMHHSLKFSGWRGKKKKNQGRKQIKGEKKKNQAPK